MSTRVKGNTYPVRNELKTLGFRWNPKSKQWESNKHMSEFYSTNLYSLSGIIVNGEENDSEIDNRSHKQIYGRCEDAPCCGCCGQNSYSYGY